MNRTEWAAINEDFEASWWGDCANTFGEELKQVAYSRVMGLYGGEWRGGDHWPVYDFAGKRVLDVGGGPTSMLLKATGFALGVVVDPCGYPAWVSERYSSHDILHHRELAEDFLPRHSDGYFDVVLCYNVLQHTLDPEMICKEMARVAKEVRLFEWVDLPAHPGHPHELHADELSHWLDSTAGRHVWLDEQYQEVDRYSEEPAVRQHGWGGVFR